GEAVEDVALRGVAPAEALLDDAHHELIRDERAQVDELLHFLAERGVLAGGAAEDVAGGDVGDAEGFRELLGLGALPDRGRADKQESHGVLCLTRPRSPPQGARRIPSRAESAKKLCWARLTGGPGCACCRRGSCRSDA